ncbi:MAG: sugar phosphate isomerase/epimerase [Candidatus Omnitrophota bacterium]|jgi:sugar phosphate isomerase/epimerase|nr:MAG: sugar phosphate isomerase/epimerase [Candidatus Omnitrophota bacterium]
MTNDIIDKNRNSNKREEIVPAIKRRDFLQTGGALAVGLGLCQGLPSLARENNSTTPFAEKLGWQVSVQHYTYRRFPLFEALDKVAEVGLRHIEIRSNLKLDANKPDINSDEKMPNDAIKKLKATLNDKGISVPSVFVDFTGNPDQAKRIFDFWKGFDTEILVAEPPADCFDLLEELCDEYKMRLAVHNHQKGRSEYWSPEIVLEVCKDRSDSIGACCDDGQWVRSGLDPVECLNKLKGRINNFHLKDVAQKGNPDSPNTIVGQGQANNAKSLQALMKLGYQGLIVIDFEHDTPDLQEDMARNIAFIEKQAQRLLSQKQG